MPEGLWKLLDKLLTPAAFKALSFPVLIVVAVMVYYHEDRLRTLERNSDRVSDQRNAEIIAIKELTDEVRKYREAYIENARKAEERALAERWRQAPGGGRSGVPADR